MKITGKWTWASGTDEEEDIIPYVGAMDYDNDVVTSTDWQETMIFIRRDQVYTKMDDFDIYIQPITK